jgi:predicted ATPase
MITKIQVNGFKSLYDFSLDLNKGLNILVGANGSGKTNIILFFEFLSLLCNDQVGNALSKIGGAGAIFRKISFDEFEKEISFTVEGTKKISNKKYLKYAYSATITNTSNFDNIYYSKQSLKTKNQTKFDTSINSKWDFEIDTSIDEKNNLIIDNFYISKSKFKNVKLFYREDGTIKHHEDEIDENLILKILEKRNLNHNIIINLLYQILDDNSFHILKDLKGGETFNIVPSKVKEIEDAANPPGIKKDGSGLAATLYAIKNEKTKEVYTEIPFFIFVNNQHNKYDKRTLTKIIDYLKLANKTIENLDVINDPFDNRLVLKINICTSEYNAVLPFSAMSDGTIKWITLITAILTSSSIFSIEEPENFLHPWMQAEIVKIMRNHINEKNEESCIIMTTHSESLLNYSEPNELILVEYFNGRTNAIRIEDVDLIKQEISNSGLGLGHFYFSNSL